MPTVWSPHGSKGFLTIPKYTLVPFGQDSFCHNENIEHAVQTSQLGVFLILPPPEDQILFTKENETRESESSAHQISSLATRIIFWI